MTPETSTTQRKSSPGSSATTRSDQLADERSPESNSVANGETEPSRLAAWFEEVSVPRWVIYAQASLLGLVGVSFFLFGILVGHFTTEGSNEVNATFDCRVIGSVTYRVDGDLRADEGAVVFLLPEARKPDKREDGNLVNPATFMALDNPAIDRIHELGGAVVRANENGQFDVVIDANYGNGLAYYLVVVSKNKRGVDTAQMTKQENAIISRFFIPVEAVIEDRSYKFLRVVAFEERLDLPEIEF